MHALSRWWERRALARPTPQLLSLFASGPTVAGVAVDPTTAVNCPAVFSCCQVLSQDVARTPVRLRRQVDDDTLEDAIDHPLYEILHDLANPETTAFSFKASMMWSLLLHGRAFAEVVRVDARVSALWWLDPAQMVVDRTPTRVKRWTYTSGAERAVWLFDPSMPPILELVNPSPVQRCRDVIGCALGLLEYTGKFFANGGRPSGLLQIPGAIDEKTATRLRESWATGYAGSRNAFRTPVLEGGVEYKPLASNHDDAQLVELQRALNEQIAGCFRVPVWKIGDLSKSTYSNMEAGSLDYVTSALDPYFQCWEEAIRRDLLTTRQFHTYTAQFDRHALVRSDMKSLHESLQSGINSGYLSSNDARKALGLNPIAGGDVYRVNLALAPVGQATTTEVPSGGA
jgi:HK97 family phage portal protein